MSKSVLLKIKSDIVQNDEREQIEFSSDGTYYEKNNKKYLSYDETELTGMEGSRVVLIIYKEQVEMHRFGTTKAKMIFKLGEKTKTNYKTPYGLFEMEVVTNQLIVNLEEGRIKIDYDLSIKGLSEGHNQLIINIKQS